MLKANEHPSLYMIFLTRLFILFIHRGQIWNNFEKCMDIPSKNFILYNSFHL